MRTIIELQQKLFPEMLDIMHRRYHILKYIQLMEPIGRRSLADNTELTERLIRGEIDFFQNQGFIEITAKGMHLTNEGRNVLLQLSDFMKELSGLSVLENRLKEKLNVDKVIIVSGNSDETTWVKHEMGKACVKLLSQLAKPNYTIAVTGGSTMAAVADMMTPFENVGGCMFVPARGGLGEHVENQANTICAEMAKKAHGQYRLLYVPDPLSEEAYKTIIEEPSIKEILHHIRHSNLVIHGIGEALTMAQRRRTPETQLTKIQEQKAVGEAFGYYFNKEGKVIHKVQTVGLQLDDLQESQNVIAVAGGRSKAQAISSYFKRGKSNILITDEGAAHELIGD